MQLRAEHLFKKYKSRLVVNDVSVEVNQGEIVGLLWSKRSRKDHIVLYDCRADQTQQR